MPNKELVIFLRPHDNAAILTKDGEMATGIVHNKQDLVDYADVMQDFMIDIMKTPQAREGVWLWKIKENWQSISGWEIEI